jgi:predicted aspartyl protease
VAREESIEELDEFRTSRPRSRAGCLGPLWVATAVPVVLLAIAVLTGVGLARNLASVPAVAAALALVLLPIVGLTSLIGVGSRLAELGGAAWFWSLALLLSVPFYFPAERLPAARAGIELLTGTRDGASTKPLVSFGEALIELLGTEPDPARFAGTLPAARVEAERAADKARRARLLREAQGDVVIAYEGRGESMQVAAFVDGSRYGEEFSMIFDTGATYTTLNRQALALLEIEVPRDAPIANLRTASGEIQAPLVLVDAVWLGDAVVEWVTVAVCEPCATDEVSGLLGLNVSGQFQVALDHDHHQIELRALDREENRKLDVARWLTLESRLLRWQDGRLEVEVQGENLSDVGIRWFSAQIDCPGGRFEVIVDGLPGRESISQKMALPRGTDCSEYSLDLRGAAWESDRF